MELTPEERQRIYLEEKERREGQDYPTPQPRGFNIAQGCFGCAGLAIVFVLVSTCSHVQTQVASDHDVTPSSSATKAPVSAPSPPPPPPVQAASQPDQVSLEVKMATIDTDGYVAEDDPKVKDYKYLLDSLQKKFPKYTREQIANVVVGSQDDLRQKGIKETLLDLGWHLDDSVPSSLEGSIKLEEAAALYVTLRIGER